MLRQASGTIEVVMLFAALCNVEWSGYFQRMRDGVRDHRPVRAGIYAMTTSIDGAGRSAEFRRRFFDQLFAAVTAQLGDLFDRRPLAPSMYVEEAEGWKRNSIHHRLAER